MKKLCTVLMGLIICLGNLAATPRVSQSVLPPKPNHSKNILHKPGSIKQRPTPRPSSYHDLPSDYPVVPDNMSFVDSPQTPKDHQTGDMDPYDGASTDIEMDAHHTPKIYPFGLDIGFFYDILSPRAAQQFALATNNIPAVAFDFLNKKIAPKTPAGRFGLYSLFRMFTLPMDLAVDFSIAQWGVASRMASIGMKPVFLNPTTGEKITSGFIGHVLAPYSALFHHGFAAGVQGLYDDMPHPANEQLFIPDQRKLYYKENGQKQNLDNLTNDSKIIIHSGTHNAHTLYAQRLVKDMENYNGHVLESSEYIRNRLLSMIMVLWEKTKKHGMNNVLTAYTEKDYNISFIEVFMFNLGSIVLNPTFYAMGMRDLDYIQTGQTGFRLSDIKGFRTPDIAMYLTSRGLSYHIASGYKLNDGWRFPLALECVFRGNPTLEGTIGIRKTFAYFMKTYGELTAILGTKGLGGSISMGFSPTTHTFIKGGVMMHDADTLMGERVIPSVESGRRGFEFWIRGGIIF